MEFSTMSDEELDKAIIDASAEREAALVKARELTAEHDRRSAEKFVATLSEDQKAQVLSVAGIPSQEGVNGG